MPIDAAMGAVKTSSVRQDFPHHWQPGGIR